MYVCQTITFVSLEIRSSFSQFRHIKTGYGSRSYWVIGSRSQEKKGGKCLFPHGSTLVSSFNR